MTVLVVGASGATGRLLVSQLLARGVSVRAIVRNPDRFVEMVGVHENLSLVHAVVLDLSSAELARHVEGCEALVSCLGHTLSFKGVYGQPRRLVSNALQRLCTAVKVHAPSKSVKVVLMNSTGCQHSELPESVSWAERCVVSAIRLLVPPHADNEQAAAYLRQHIGPDDPHIEWVIVRPDTLVDHDAVSAYTLHASPTRSAIFDPGKTSRCNVGHFMSELLTHAELWDAWKGQSPVIYNRATSTTSPE